MYVCLYVMYAYLVCTYAYEYSNMRNKYSVCDNWAFSEYSDTTTFVVSLVDYNAFEYSITVLQL